MKLFKLSPQAQEILKLVFFNSILLLFFLELGSLAFYFVTQKEFFYARSKAANRPQEISGISLNENRLNESVLERLHPFFGYIAKPGLPFALEFSKVGHTLNNYGFPSAYDYPFIKTNENQFVIGVFGGSVAANYAVYENETQILAKELKKLPTLANREIILLPFATGGYKEPQQLLLLNYFLSLGQSFDLVINIDGFNEVALSNLNNEGQIEISMPSVQHILPLQQFANQSFSAEELKAIAKIAQYKNELRNTLTHLDDCAIASCYAFKWFSLQNLARGYQNEVIKMDKLRGTQENLTAENQIFIINQMKAPLPETDAFNKMVNLWANASRLMQKNLANQNALYFHFIQPNQYYPTQRTFSEAEKKIAIVENHPYAAGVQKGYPLLLAKAQELQADNINLFNGVNIFDQTPETVYIDSCCHYNEKGSEIFSQYVAQKILEVLRKNPPSFPSATVGPKSD